MALLRDLFGIQAPAQPAGSLDEAPDDLLRRAMMLNRVEGVNVGPMVSEAPALTAPPMEPMREIAERPIASIPQPAPAPAPTPRQPQSSWFGNGEVDPAAFGGAAGVNAIPGAPAPRQSVPMQAPAAAQPSMAPARPVPVQASPSIGDRLGAFLAAGGEGSLARGFAAATTGLDRQTQAKNDTATILQSRFGLTPDEAMAVARNPGMMQQVLPYIAPKPRAKESDAIEQYKFYQNDELRAGRQPKGFEEYKKTIAQAGASSVKVDVGGENAYARAVGEGQGKAHVEILNAGRDANAELSSAQQMAELAKSFKPGASAVWLKSVGSILQTLGVKVDGLDEIQAFQAMKQRLVQTFKVPGSGPQTEGDAARFGESLPSLGNTPGGNEIINSTLQAIARTKQQAAQIVLNGQIPKEEGGINKVEVERQLQALPNPFAEFNKFRAAAPAAPAETPKAPALWTDPDTGATVRRKQ